MTSYHKEFSASLQVTSTTRDVTEISSRLSIKGTSEIQRGQPVSKRPGAVPAVASIWTLESTLERSNPLEAHVGHLIGQIQDQGDVLWALSSNCQIEIWCFASFSGAQLGFHLGHELLESISKYPITIIFDIYGES